MPKCMVTKHLMCGGPLGSKFGCPSTQLSQCFHQSRQLPLRRDRKRTWNTYSSVGNAEFEYVGAIERLQPTEFLFRKEMFLIVQRTC
jgi:hypothetical protein